MSWTDLLFLHWRAPIDQVRRTLPRGIDVDTFDGEAWIGLVPFTMTDCRFAGFGLVPGLSDFHECNVRTYVRAGDRRGVWFYSLDAASLFPVIGGRLLWRLNYVYSRFDVTRSSVTHDYALHRRPGPWPEASTRLAWSTGDPRPLTTPGSLEHFLTERYWLFTKRRRRIWAGRIRHDPWPLCDAVAEVVDDSLLRAAGFDRIAGDPPLAMAAHRIDVTGDPLVAISENGSG
jgi:hypothetical protein